MTATSPPALTSSLISGVDRFVEGLLRHWLLFVGLALGIWTTLPWLAPILMHLGWYRPAWWIYFIYSLFCHQLPQRSWFLFGPRFTPSLAEIQAASGAGRQFLRLAPFPRHTHVGLEDLAWSDRMVSFYGGWFLFVLLYGLLRGRVHGLRPIRRGLRWQAALLLMLPMAVDGIAHMLSDLWGVTAGFRQSNAWLAASTGKLLPPTFLHRGCLGFLQLPGTPRHRPADRVRPDLLAAALSWTGRCAVLDDSPQRRRPSLKGGKLHDEV